MKMDGSWLEAADACRALAITPATLYAYVSRGFIRSQPGAARSRARRYSRDDVERLRQRKEGRRDPDRAAAHTLQWGLPVLESSIALIADNRLYYRGHDAVELARTRSIAEIASLIWTGTFDARFRDDPGAQGPSPAGRVPFVQRAQVALALAAAGDPQGFDLRPQAVAQTGWRILSLLGRTAARRRPTRGTLDGELARAWDLPVRDAAILKAALVLCADHELNVSSFTARCVASAGSSPYAVVMAGLAALEGARHGGVSVRVESLLASLRRTRDVRRALGERLRRGDAIEGFGHPLYPEGDPRAAALLDLLRERYPRSAELRFAQEFAASAARLGQEAPTIDFALATVARVLRLPAGSPLTMFALGRTIGWIGHAIEQYGMAQIIRPRAKYAGPPPDAIRS